MTHMYGKEVSIDISAAQEAQREHDANTFRQDRRWMYGVDLMPKLPETYVFKEASGKRTTAEMINQIMTTLNRANCQIYGWNPDQDSEHGIFSRDDLPDYNYT